MSFAPARNLSSSPFDGDVTPLRIRTSSNLSPPLIDRVVFSCFVSRECRPRVGAPLRGPSCVEERNRLLSMKPNHSYPRSQLECTSLEATRWVTSLPGTMPGVPASLEAL